MVDLRKRLVRDLQAARPGMKPTAAVRLLDRAAAMRSDPPRAWARLVASHEDSREAGAGSGTYWKVEVRPVAGDWGRPGILGTRWIRQGSPRFIAELVEALADGGWEYPGTWPAGPDETVLLPLWRNDRGRREDEAAAIHASVGKTYHELPELYAAAVADALDRAGVSVAHYWANPDDPRSAAIELAHPPAPYEDLHLIWGQDTGWCYVPTRDTGASADDFAEYLPVPLLALPTDVSDAVVWRVTAPDKPAGEPCPWTPPAWYTTDPALPEDDIDYSPALERALAAYATHPAARS